MAAESEFPKVDGEPAYASEYNGVPGLLLAEAGENITAKNAVYLDTDGKFYVSDNTTQTDDKFTGFALQTKTSGNDIYVQSQGIMQGLSTLTAGSVYYVGTSGGVTTSVGNGFIGTANSTTTISILNQGESAWQVLATSEPTATNTITFSSVANYKTFKIIAYGTTTVGANNLTMRFNADTGANYRDCRFVVSGAAGTTVASATNNMTSIYVGQMNTGATNRFSAEVLIKNNASGEYKTALINSGDVNVYSMASAVWKNTSAVISSITLFTTNNYEASTKFVLLGLRGEI